MTTLVAALAPAFAAGFAVQRLLEILDPLFEYSAQVTKYKKSVLGITSLVIGLLLAGAGLRVIAPLEVGSAPAAMSSSTPGENKQQSRPIPEWADLLITALIISGGTEGFNSVMKFLNYKKEEKKGDAATTIDNSPLAKTEQGKALVDRLTR